MNHQTTVNRISLSRKNYADTGAAKQQYNILVVDDDVLTLEVVKRVFQSEGHWVVGINDGEKAARFLDFDEFDYIYLDVVLHAGVTGFDLFELIRLKSNQPRIKFMTGYFLDDQMDQYIKKADGVVWKPFTRKELLTSLEREQTLVKALPVSP